MPVLPRFDLTSLAVDAARFARALPALAASLSRPVPEPATERLVEGVYFLGGTVLDKVADFQAAAHEALAERVCPWLRRPIPSATVVAFDAPHAGRVIVPAGRELAAAPLEGVSCVFRLLSDASLAALRVSEASVDARPGQTPVVRLTLESTGPEPLNRDVSAGLALYIDGELENALRVVHTLTAEVQEITVASPDWDTPLRLDPGAVARGGLTPEEAVAPDPDGMPPAFGVMTEAFLFPHKFRFVKIGDLGDCARRAPTSRLSFAFVLSGPLLASAELDAAAVRVNCAVAVNLFDAAAEPIPLALERGPTPIRIGGLPRRAGGVYAVREARLLANGTRLALSMPDGRRLSATATDPRCPASFSASLEATADRDPDLCVAFSPRGPAGLLDATVSLRVLATNRTLAERLRVGDLSGTTALHDQALRYRNVVAASRYVPPPLGDAFAIRAVRHAAVRRGLGDPLAALKDALFLSVPSWTGDAESVRALDLRIEAIQSMTAGVARRRESRRGGEVTRHGYAYEVTVDESAFRGPGDLGLFGAALGEALSRSVPVNTFTEVTLVGIKTGFRSVYPRRMPAPGERASATADEVSA